MNKTKLISQGFESLKKAVMPENASQIQIDEMQKAFYAGAQYALSTVITLIDHDSEPTEQDLELLSSIMNELEDYFLAL